MNEPAAGRFELVEWAEEAPGVRAKALAVEGARWALVEYEAGAGRPEWCSTPHHGLVLEGAIRYEFDDGRDDLALAAGQAFVLPTAPAHRGRNHGASTARLFVIDDPE